MRIKINFAKLFKRQTLIAFLDYNKLASDVISLPCPVRRHDHRSKSKLILRLACREFMNIHELEIYALPMCKFTSQWHFSIYDELRQANQFAFVGGGDPDKWREMLMSLATSVTCGNTK